MKIYKCDIYIYLKKNEFLILKVKYQFDPLSTVIINPSLHSAPNYILSFYMFLTRVTSSKALTW